MKSILAAGLLASAQLAVAVPDPLITPRAQLAPRQDDPYLVGWVSTSGASEFSDLRSCDFPATLSTSGSYAQCCDASAPCNFYTSCNGGVLQAESTSVTCDQNVCNTGVIVPTIGASDGQSFLGCWAASLGDGPFSLVQDVGDAIATPTGAASSEASSEGSSGGNSSPTSRPTRSSTGAAPAASSTNASNNLAREPLSGGLFGMVAMLFALF